MYSYFVSYRFSNGKTIGVGNCSAEFKEKIKSMEDIRSMEKRLAKESNFKWVTITNFVEFGRA